MNNHLKGRSILILGASFMQQKLIETALQHGMHTVVMDRNPKALGFAKGFGSLVTDTNKITRNTGKTKEKQGNFVRRILANFGNEKEAVYAALQYHEKEHRLEACVTVGTDFSITVAKINKALGNNVGITETTATWATNKLQMRQRFAEHGVSQPLFYGMAAAELENILNLTREKSLKKAEELLHKLENLFSTNKFVVKPVDSMGARGVRLVQTAKDFIEALGKARYFSKSAATIIEEYIPSNELSVDALIYKGKIFISGVADRIIEHSPYFVETGHTLPSELPEESRTLAIEEFKKGIIALGIHSGAAKADIRVCLQGRKVWLGEIAARLSGGFMSSYTTPLHSGADLMQAVLEISLGMPPSSLQETRNQVVVERAIQREGAACIFMGIENLAQAKKIQGLAEIFLFVKKGDLIQAPKNNMMKIGSLIAYGKTKAEAETSARQANQILSIKTKAT